MKGEDGSSSVPTADLLGDALGAIEKMKVEVAASISPGAVDIQEEFSSRVNDLSLLARNVVSGIVNEDKEPTEIISGLQGLARSGEDLAIRFRKVDHDESERLRKLFLEIQYSQPGGTVQMMRDIMCGVFEGDGRGCECLMRVLNKAGEICGALEEMDKSFASTSV